MQHPDLRRFYIFCINNRVPCTMRLVTECVEGSYFMGIANARCTIVQVSPQNSELSRLHAEKHRISLDMTVSLFKR